MRRHEAPDGAPTHPLVADALSRRPVAGGRRVHEEPALPGREGPIGWPGSAPDEVGEPIGWPDGRAEDRPEDELPSGTAGRAARMAPAAPTTGGPSTATRTESLADG